MKYRVKGEAKDFENYIQVCIECGKERVYKHPISILPRPNTTLSIRKPAFGKLSCFIGDHQYYFEDEVEKL